MSFSEWSNKKKKREVEDEQSAAVTPSAGSYPTTTTGKRNTTSFSDWSNKKTEKTSVKGWANASKRFLDEVQQYYGKYHEDDEEVYTGFQSRASELLASADNWRKQHSGDDEAVSYINSVVGALSDAKNYALKSRKYYSQFDSELSYNRYKNYGGKSYDEIKAILNGMEEDAEDYEWLKEYAPSAVFNSEDFEHYSKLGMSVSNPSWEDSQTPWNIFGWKPFGEGEDIKNIVTFAEKYEEEAAIDALSTMNGGGYDSEHTELVTLINRYMKDDEKAIYNYFIGKGYFEQANEYMTQIADVLRQRAAGRIAEHIDGTAFELPASLAAGVEQFGTGVKNLGAFITGDEGLPTSVTQYAHAAMSGNNDGAWKVVNDLTYTTGNMLPSILVGSLTGGVGGAITMGTSAAGNAYAEMRNLGYDEWQSRGYGVLVGASEAALSSLLGGISKLGGKVSGNAISKLVSKLDNAFARTAITLGGSMLSEGVEEAIQTVLEPAFKALMTGENFESPKWDEILYSGLLGALSAGVFEGVPTIANTVNENRDGKRIYGENQNELVAEGLESAEGSLSNTLAQKYQQQLDLGRDLNGIQLNRLADANEQQIVAEDISKIQNAVEERLTRLGETGDVKLISAALTKQVTGEKLTRAETQVIKNSKYGQRVANELNTENIQSGEYSSAWAERLDTNRINWKEYSRLVDEAQITQEAVRSPDSTTPTAKQNEVEEVKNEPVSTSAETVEKVKPDTIAQEDTEVKAPWAEKVNQPSVSAAEEQEDDGGKAITIEEASKEYGAQAGAMLHTYKEGQDVAKYNAAYRQAYNMGQSGVSLAYAMDSKSTEFLTEKQRELAYEAGRDAALSAATEQDKSNRLAANGKTGWKKGAVRGDGVTISDIKTAFNDIQNTAYKLLSTYAEATGIDIVLYRSEAGTDGKFREAQGKYSRSEPGTIYIDINAGLSDIKSVNDLAKYTMIRTFSHEFIHFIENWNPVQYNEFRKVVFDTLTERGENVHDLIEEKQSQTPGMTYDKASREVVAEAMTDILPDANFVEELAKNHKTIFDKLLEKLEEFLETLKQYFASIGYNRSREANALKEQVGDAVHYVESIVKLFDRVATEAVEIYQATIAIDEVTGETSIDETKVENEVVETAETSTKEPETVTEVAQEVPFDKRTLSMLKSAQRIGVAELEGQKYVSNGSILLPTTAAGAKYAYVELNAVEMKLNEAILNSFAGANTLITKAPTEGKINRDTIYTFDVGDKKLFFGKKLFSFIDGGLLYYGDYTKEGAVIKSVNEEGSINGYLLSMRLVDASKITDEKPSKLKSFSKKMQAIIDAQTVSAVEVTKKSENIDSIVTTSAEENVSTVEKAPTDEAGTPSEKLASMLLDGYINAENINRGGKALTSKELYALADEAFGGTQAEGAYNRKDAYDAMELAVNKFLLKEAARAYKTFNGTAKSAVSTVEFMQDMLELLPTQNVRTQEMEDFQQFSTPPNIAYLAAWAANIKNSDFVLEPSAGIGGLAVFAKAWGAEVAVNELSKRRLEVLRAMGFDHLFNENAEHIDNILPDNISPSVVIMNPPFSSTAGRTANNKTSNAEKHIDQALARLRDGGRLVAVLGKSMNDTDYYKYWDKLRKNFNIRANLSIDGNNYKKYGTTWGVQIVVIDKTGPQTGETVTGKFTDLTQIPKILEVIRNDRISVEENRVTSTNDSIRESVSDGRNEQTDRGHEGGSEHSTGSTGDTEPKKNRKGIDTDKGTGDRADGKRPAESSTKETGSEDGGRDRAAGYADTGDSNRADRSDTANRPQSELPLSQLSETEEVSDDGVYATFVAPDIPIKGGKKHPAVLVESAAMAAVSMPKATYKVKLPADVINNNLSDAQLVTVTYAGQAHEQKLPDGRRKGFFIGDGTGVGKGRQIAGIILDNFMQGRDKAVWISKNDDLYGDAVRDWTATTGRSKDEVVSQGKFKPKDKITLKNGILFTSYGKLKMEKGGSRLDQIVNWLGEDFDGVIAFDEAHFMGNLFGKKGKFGKSKGSLTAQAGVELQRRLPNARIVYVSATAATEVDNLAYAERIGLWGQGTAFTNAQDFIAKIGASGLAAMELVIRDMKAMGTYVARSISYNGVNYDTVEHALSPMQTEIYNTMSRAWQKTMSNVQSALETTGGKYNSTERQRALGNFYSGMQRFYNQVLTSMSMPSVIADMRRELDAGHSCVLQIVNTNEAQQNKQLAEAKANGESLDNLDLTPREALIGYLMNSFPTQMFEEYTDDDGNLRSRPVMDSAGNPVQNKEAIRQRDALVAEVNQMSIPDGPLEMLFDAFGSEAVAENTGRSRRVVPKKMSDGSVTRVEESRTLNHRTADVQAFQDGKKRILVFSDAGGTGKSYHADRTEKNQQLRIHYVLQPGWVASNAVQGFGRTHRSNEASAPIYKLVTTNIKGQKRFTSTIARRLDQLGALTKGQRDTGSGMFGAKDNLETDLAKDSLREFYRRLGKNQIEDIDGMKTLDRLGLKEKFTDEFGAFKINDNLARDISTFLNRILALEVDEQNIVFDAFIGIYEMELEAAIQAGTIDTGMENVKADKIEVVDDKVIRKDDNTGSETHYIQAKTYTKPKIVTTVDEMSKRRDGFMGLYRTESGAVRAVYRIADKTTEWGAIQKQYRLASPNLGAKTAVWNENTLTAKAEAIDKAEWQKEWDAEVERVPEYNEDTLHMLTGALLPIWNSLPQEGNTKVKRLITQDGDTYLGRVIDKEMIDTVLGRFSIGRTKEVFTASQVMDKAIESGVRFYLTNNKTEIFRSKVSGEWRLEITQPYNSWYLMKTYPGLIQERIQYRDRYFIPVGDKGVAILEKLLQDNPVRNTADDTEQYQTRAYLSEEKYSYEWFVNKPDMAVTTVDDSATYSRADLVAMAQKNAASVGYTNQDGNAVVHVDDTDTDVLVSKHGLLHGLDRRLRLLTPVTLKIGEILKNSIRINELIPAKQNVAGSYVLIGAAQNYKGDFYIVRSVVNSYNNELSSIDVLYAVHTKKESAVLNEPAITENPLRITDSADTAALLPRLTDESATFTDSVISISHLLEYVNRYFPDILPESVLKHFGYDARPEGTIGEDALYQQRTDTLTNREILAMAAGNVNIGKLTDAQQDALNIFQKHLARLEELEEKRAEQGRLYKEQQFGKNVDREAAAATLNRMRVLDDQIRAENNDLFTIEEKAVLREILEKARSVVEQVEREHGREILRRWRDRRNNAAAIKKYRERLRADVDELTNWVLHPDNKSVVKHIPDALKDTVIPFLSSINFMSKQSLKGGNTTVADKAFMEQLRKLEKVMGKAVDVDEMYSNYTDLPQDFMQNLRNFMDSAQHIIENSNGEFVINQMTAEELRTLSKVVSNLKTYIMKMNRFHVNAMFRHVYEAGDNSIEYLSEIKSAGNTGAVSQFLLWQQMRPAYAFERFGEGGRAIYDGLRRGQATLAFNTKKIQAFSEKAYTTAEVKAWENQIKTIRLGPAKTVTMRVSQIMSLYELSKREQALGHILGEGIRVATFKNGKKKISDVGQRITSSEMNLIIRELTPRQKEVADSLQQFMQEQGGEWGNHVTVARFGEKLFGEEHYFPINSDGRHLQVDADERPGAAALYALLNMSFTKQTQEKARNRIILYSIFDVFANHMASMAQYNAFALPVVDAIKWFNYQQTWVDENGAKTILGSVREQMDRAYGVPEETRPGSGRRGYAQSFVINIIKAFNGTEAQGTPNDTFGLQTLHHYNRAQVAFNFRVVVQQPLAITRAASMLDYGSIIKGMKLNPKAIQNNIAEMQKYSGIAAWKSLGFYDVNISRGLTSIIKHDDTLIDKVTDVGMWGAEKADLMTWAGIWSAAKEEVIKKQKLTPKSAGFYEAVTKLFEDIIYKTQVVDSVLTKNEFMRDKGFFARAVGSFMSEPTTTASMLIDAYDKYHTDIQRGMSRQQAWKKNSRMIVRTAYVYGVGAMLLAAVQAAADALRDDDDYQEFMEKWLEAFGGNLVDELMPVNKLPILSDFYEVAKEILSTLGVDTYGNAPQSVFMQWYDSLVKGAQILHDKIIGEDTNYTWYGGAYKLLQAASGMTGLPMAAATREIVTAWNNIIGGMAPSLKVKTYEPKEKTQIKYAYQDGYLTAEEAMEQLLTQGIVDTEDEAYFTVREWGVGEDYSRYDDIYDAVRNGGDFDAAMDELVSHGYTEKDVLSQLKGKIGEWYKGGEITKQQAINMLTKYFDMDSEDITEAVNKWSAKVVTGMEYNDIKDEYLSGNITASRAVEMYMRYGGYTKEDAESKVQYIDFGKKYPQYDLSEPQVTKYYSELEHTGLGVPEYAEYIELRKDCKGVDEDGDGKTDSGSVKAEVMRVIDSLPITYEQKDALYYFNGWAESRINEAPWH